MDNPRHFVLVHGACHGAWCWYKVVALLQSSGHKVTALDMAASGIHPKQVHELDSITDYYEPLIEFVRSLPQDERVILVGHSSGGIGISMAMELFPKKIAVAVFVASIVPSPDLGFVTINKEYPHRSDFNLERKIIFDDSSNNKSNGSIIHDPQFLASNMYQLSPSEDLSLATLLQRPTRTFGDQELLQKKTNVTNENYGIVAKVCIVCQQDKLLKYDFQLSMAERNSKNDVKVIPDADHMPMFSKPQELFAYLQEIAEIYY
ncbi:methyl jasmonate esterase 1-like isoform X1 [Vicia villosa]|uniref:methyl jasmonate esterase 1-like isoform X1 n=1 Tax=Vicia villosa TaxID=3911 RepID=UPI00273BC435|nr:methyl jasmonate esterase 1-like isoform X1 [Vicia villosa]